MNKNELITVPEHLKVNPSIDVEVTEIHNSDDIEVTNTAEYTSSNVWHYPAMKALGGVAIAEGQGEFRGDPSKVPGTEAYAQRQAEISNLAYSELAATKMHSR